MTRQFGPNWIFQKKRKKIVCFIHLTVSLLIVCILHLRPSLHCRRRDRRRVPARRVRRDGGEHEYSARFDAPLCDGGRADAATHHRGDAPVLCGLCGQERRQGSVKCNIGLEMTSRHHILHRIFSCIVNVISGFYADYSAKLKSAAGARNIKTAR